MVMVIVAVIVVEECDIENFYGYRNAQGKKMYVPPNLSERFLFQRTPFRRLDGFKSVWHNSNCELYKSKVPHGIIFSVITFYSVRTGWINNLNYGNQITALT